MTTAPRELRRAGSIRRWQIAVWVLLVAVAVADPGARTADGFDHDYRAYAEILRDHLVNGRVDYAELQRTRQRLDAAAAALGRVTERDLQSWSREKQIAYWINAYNIFTLVAIVDHYPIEGGWFSWLNWWPRNSIRQIDGVWDELTWKTARGLVTLDHIEHEILRKQFDEPRIHFAVNCASISCPPLRPEPYRGESLERQLVVAARDFLATEHGTRVEGATLYVARVLDWYGSDFVARYAPGADSDRSGKERAIVAVIARYGPRDAAALAETGAPRLRFLPYDWSLNDVPR